jgi:hypothetical protein
MHTVFAAGSLPVVTVHALTRAVAYLLERLGSAAHQTLLQFQHVRRRDEKVLAVQARSLDVLNALDVDVQYTDLALRPYLNTQGKFVLLSG